MTTTEVASGYSQSRAAASEAAGSRRLRWLTPHLPVDIAAMSAGVALAEIGAARAGVPPTPLAVLLGFPALTLFLLAARGTYRQRLHGSIFEDLRVVATSSALAAMLILCLRAFSAPDSGFAQQGARLWVFTACLVAAGRLTHHWSERSARRAGESLRPTLIVGAGRVGRLTAQRLLAMPQLGLKPIGFLDKDPLKPAPGNDVLPVLGASWDLEEVVRRHNVQQVIVTFSTAPNEVMLRLFRRCEELGLAISMVPRLYEMTTTRLSVEHLGGLPLVSVYPSDPRGFQFALKYALDRIVSATLILLVSPLLIAAAVATYLSAGRPILFRQRRIGRDGVEFDMLKFRTMNGSPDERGELDAGWAQRQLGADADVEEMSSPAEDPRTKVGSFLRRTSIDELPQLLNVLMGHMSLVGPRPERSHYVRRFEGNVYRYGERHRVKSGITGWAQVNGLRGQTSLEDRVEWDNYYIENFSLWLDLKILLLTVAAVLRLTSD